MSVVKGTENAEDIDLCSICREALLGRGDYEFKCKHRMHARCAFDFRRDTNAALKCPLCRVQVDEHLRHHAYPFITFLFGTLRFSIKLYLAKMAAHAMFRAYDVYPVGVCMWILWAALVLLSLVSINTSFARRR